MIASLTENVRRIFAFALLSLIAVLCGAVTMAVSGVGPATFLQNFAAWIAGFGLALLLPPGPINERLRRAVPVVCIVFLAASFLGLEQSGVHRWIGLWPLHVNAAALALPSAIVLVENGTFGLKARAAILIAIMVILCLQPDASQACAFAAAGCIIMCGAKRWQKYIVAVLIMALAAASCWRPDPLQPVDIVEDILSLTWHQMPLLSCAAVATLAALCPAPWLMVRNRSALALSAYFALLSLAPIFGHFPVPLVGLGLSFPIGWWLGFALLTRQEAGGSGDDRN